MKVKNINGTSQSSCKCGTWLNHWKRFSGATAPTYCPVKDCLKKDLVGAHVQKDSSFDRDWYIVPLCSGHNGQTGSALDVADHVTLVPANVSETRGN